MQDGTNAILKMEAAYSTEMLVPIYKPHDITLQNMASVIFIDKVFIRIQNDRVYKTIPLHNLQFKRNCLYGMCVTMQQHRSPTSNTTPPATPPPPATLAPNQQHQPPTSNTSPPPATPVPHQQHRPPPHLNFFYMII